MTSALFGNSKNLILSFPAACIFFSKVFHFHGSQPVSRDCFHVAMCTNSICSDYALMFTQGRNPVSTSTLYNSLRRPCFRLRFRKFFHGCRALLQPSRILPATKPHDISTPKNKDTPLPQSQTYAFSYDALDSYTT